MRHPHRHLPKPLLTLLLIPLLVVVMGPAVGTERAPAPMHVLSSRPETVSGNDVLIQLDPAPLPDAHWSVRLNGHDVTASFKPTESGHFQALLTGLHLGHNALQLTQSGRTRYTLELTNHPLAGPVFSGPHQHPFTCDTSFNGLGPPLDADCGAPTRVEYYYKPKDPIAVDRRESMARALEVFAGKRPASIPPGLATYDPEHPARNVAEVTLADGRTVPYIVRREIGVINRAVYDIRFLHEPGKPLPTPWGKDGSAWNGRLVYGFVGGCVASFGQGYLVGPASDEVLLALGYAVATATLNVFINSCNAVLSAETLSMVKEHFIKSYGVPVHTIGWGDSAGAIQQYLTAQNYPGLLDGIIPFISFPDILSTIVQSSDCALLDRGFQHSDHTWTESQKTAVSGFATWRTCATTGGSAALLPRDCPPTIPADQIYDPAERPRGVRCDLFDNELNIYGRDPKTGFAARPLDNVGVQYGLAAFESGQIDAERFIELNERVGGFDADGNPVPHRMEADPEALRRAYQHGLIFTGGGGLSSIPIIDWRWYSDDQGDEHDSFHSFVTRARVIAANGGAANQVMLIDARANSVVVGLTRLAEPNPQGSLAARREGELVRFMDRWLDTIAADSTHDSLSAKIARDKPVELAESCWATDGEHIIEPLAHDGGGRCTQLYPSYGNPRTAAGGPLSDDILKCALKPVAATHYTHELSAAQRARLEAVFPSGVCDYTRPGVGQEVTHATWQSY